MREIVLSEKEIAGVCSRLGKEVSNDLRNEEKIPLFVGVMKGAMPFFHEFIKNIDIPIFTDYIQISSYSGTETTGQIKLLKDLMFDTKGRTIVVVEDIIDSGYSMHYLIEHLKKEYQPKDIKVVVMFDKINARKIDVPIHYVGKVLEENKFIVGFGLDYEELFRNTPYVYVAKPSDIADWNDILHSDRNKK